MNIKMLKAAVAGLVLSVSGFANAGILLTEVSEDAYITIGGYDIAWVAPVSQNSGSWLPVDYSHQSQFGWSALTLSVYNEIGGLDADDFTGDGFNAMWNGSSHVDSVSGGSASGVGGSINSIAIATAWFSNQHLHIDYNQAIGGNAWSGADFEGGSCANSCNESLAFRVSAASAQVPEPSTLAIFALGIMGLVSRRLKK